MTGAEVDGLPALLDGLEDAAAALADLTTVNQRAGDAVLGVVRFPRRTGYLASTAAVEADPAGWQLVVGADYAVPVHARNPFLTTALDRKAGDVVDTYTDGVADAVHHVKGK